jgi:hypothetical protein
MPKITHEELLAEIERIDRSGSDGATVTELVEQTGLSRDTILGRLRVMHYREMIKRGALPAELDDMPGYVPDFIEQ